MKSNKSDEYYCTMTTQMYAYTVYNKSEILQLAYSYFYTTYAQQYIWMACMVGGSKVIQGYLKKNDPILNIF